MSRSTGCLNTLMKMIAAFLAFIVIVALPISLLIYNVARVVFSPEIMSDLLRLAWLNQVSLAGSSPILCSPPSSYKNKVQESLIFPGPKESVDRRAGCHSRYSDPTRMDQESDISFIQCNLLLG